MVLYSDQEIEVIKCDNAADINIERVVINNDNMPYFNGMSYCMLANNDLAELPPNVPIDTTVFSDVKGADVFN
jgi:hypothetical protein